MHLHTHDKREDRVARLQKALLIATTICGLTSKQADILIESLRDDRGTLIVTWVCPPSDQQINAFRAAWGLCKESDRNVLHVCDGAVCKG